MILKGERISKYNSLHGGEGQVVISKFLENKEVDGLNLFAKVSVEKGASIGYHQHIEESEGYYILNGSAEFIDSDRSHKQAGPGDLCLITKGQSHGIINKGESALEFLAIVF